VLISDGAGGNTSGGPDLDPQVFRIVPSGSRQAEVRTVGGEVVNPDYAILAAYDADIQDGDSFTYLDKRCEVVFVYDIGGYERRADVVRRA
jgi:SPP1 family predicted phage head-tail adaptor